MKPLYFRPAIFKIVEFPGALSADHVVRRRMERLSPISKQTAGVQMQ